VVVSAQMLYAGCTDAGHNSTFCLMPTVYISHDTYNYLAIKFKLPRRKLSCTDSSKKKLPVKSHCKIFHKKLLSNNILLKDRPKSSS